MTNLNDQGQRRGGWVWAGPGALQWRVVDSGGLQVRWAGRQQQPTVTGRQEEIERAHSRHLEPPRGGPVLLLLANIILVLLLANIIVVLAAKVVS